MRAGSGHQGVNTKIFHENKNLDVLLCYRRTVLDNLNPASSSSKFRKDRLDSGIKWPKMPIFGRKRLTKLFADGVKKLLYKLVKSDCRWYFWVLRSEWSKKWQKMIILRGGGIKWLKNPFLVGGG